MNFGNIMHGAVGGMNLLNKALADIVLGASKAASVMGGGHAGTAKSAHADAPPRFSNHAVAFNDSTQSYNPIYNDVARTRGFFKDPFSPTGWSYSNARGDIAYSPNAPGQYAKYRAGNFDDSFTPSFGGGSGGSMSGFDESLVKRDFSGMPLQPYFERTQGIEISKPAVGTPEYSAYKAAHDEWFRNKRAEMNDGTSFGENMSKIGDWFTRPAKPRKQKYEDQPLGITYY